MRVPPISLRPLRVVSSTAILLRATGLVAVIVGTVGISGVFLGSQPAALKVSVAAFLLLSIWRLGDALVVLAALGPLGGALSVLSGSPQPWTTTLVLTLVAGAGIRAVVQPRPPRDPAATGVAMAWIALILSSALVECWLRASLDLSPGPTFRNLFNWLLVKYPAANPGYAFVTTTVMTVSMTAVFAIAVQACRADAGLPARIARALVLTGTALGVLAVYRLVEVSLMRPPFVASLATFAQSLRVSPVIADVNAVSALLLLLLPVAVGLLWTRARRWTAAIAVPCLLAGLWLAGSRTALALVPVAFMIQAWPWLRLRAPATRRVVGGVALLAAVGGAALFFFSRNRAHGTVDGAVNIRADMAITVLRMASAYPVFGVGIGNLYERSTEFMPEQMSSMRVRRDAHNQYLQVLGELGLTGLAAFCALLWVSLAPGVKALARGAASAELSGYIAGGLTFLMVSVGQHPLLIPEVSLVFFLLLALARAGAMGPAGSLPVARRWPYVFGALAVLACVAAAPWRVADLRRGRDLEGVSHGFSSWTRADGRAWRSSRLPAVFFVSSSAHRITLPLRLRAPRSAGAIAMQIRVDGQLAMQLQLANGKWMETSVTVPTTGTASRSLRVDVGWVGARPPRGTRVDIGVVQAQPAP